MLPASDGLITVRPFVAADRPVVLRGRDEQWERWLGPGSPDPAPTACIEVRGEVVGWIDVDPTPAWLRPGEANVGYSVFLQHRGNGHAAGAIRLLSAELDAPGLRRMLLVIDVRNEASLSVARAVGAQLVENRTVEGLPTSVVYAVECAGRTIGA